MKIISQFILTILFLITSNYAWTIFNFRMPLIKRLKLKSKEFEGKTRVKQHQMVYESLQGRMGNELHAMALQTSVPK